NRGRYLTLDLATTGQGYAAFNGAALTFDLAPGAAPALTVDVNAGMKWMSYCAPATGAVTLSPCSDDEAWGTLESRYAALAPQPDDEEPGWVGARVMLAQLFFTGMRSGFYANVQAGPQILSQFGLETESQTALAVRAARQGAATVPLLAAQSFYRLFPGYVPGDSPRIQKKATLGYAGVLREGLKDAKENLADKISTGPGSDDTAKDYAKALAKLKTKVSSAKYLIFRFGAAIAGAAGAVLMVSLQIASLVPNLPNQTRLILGAFSTALNILINVVAPIVDLVRSIIQSPLSAARVLSFVGKSFAVVQRGAAVGAVLASVLIWGFFIYGAATSGLAAGSPTLNRLFFETVAATIVTVLMAVLTANPVGAIISAILGAIDAILSLICELGVAELRQVPTLDGACFTLTGALTKVLTKLLYSYDLMIDMGRSDLMVTGAPDVVLGDPGKGFVAGNTLNVTLPVTTTAVHKDPDPNNGVLIYPYMYLFSADNLRRSSFLYSLTSGANQTLAVALDQMKTLWQNVRVDHTYLVSPMYRGEMSSTPPPVTGQVLAAGIDRPVPLMLNMSYAVPAYECWTLVVIPICYTREYKGDNHMPIDSLHYDVFPATFAEFLAMSAKGDGGLGLSWDARFPSLRDADGDGLLSTAYNGLDPNDAAADADGDGLTDRFELDRRAAGVNISPVLRDTDNDGLPDAQELRLGTDPAAADSDNDGLSDGAEVAHLTIDPNTGALTTVWAGGWNVTINALTPFTVRVSSDPLNADGDNDGINDLAERQLALDPNPANRVDSQNRPYHPAVPNSPPLAVVVETDDFDGYVAPGQSFIYTSTVIANAAAVPGVLNVNAPAILGGARNPLLLPFNTQTFSVTQSVAQGVSVAVAPGLGTQQTALSSTASTRLSDTAVAGWTLGQVTTEAPLGGIVVPNLPYYSEVTASRPDRQDNFHIGVMAFDNLNSPVPSPIGRGDILAYTLPAGSMRAIENDAGNTRAFMGNSAPSMATNAAGDTFAAWGQQRFCNTVTFNSIRVVTAGADAQDASNGIEPIIALTPNGGTESIAWRWDTGGGSMTGGQTRGPNANGFPVSADFCNGTVTFRVYDNDGATNELVASQSVFMYSPVNGVLTFTGAGHTIEVNVTIPVIDRFVIAGALLGPDGQVKRSITFPRSPISINAIRGSFGPAVATDGDGFLVAYESYAETAPSTPGLPQIVVQAFDKDGNPLQSSYQAALSAQASDLQYNSIALAATWIGNAYRVVWQDRRAAQVRIIDAVRSGASMSGPLQIFGNALTNAGANYGPSVAYDPLTGRVLTVFLSDFRRVIGILQNGGTVIGNPLVLSLAQFPDARSPQVAWHPGYRGWLVSYQDDTASQRHVFVPVNSDGLQAFPAASGFFIAANDNSLACPAPQSAPVVDLRFEELPGATSFADASGRGNPGLCTGASCPLAGFSGAPNAPLSDYAARFDGIDDGLTINRTIQDDFSVAFWIKAPPSTGQRTIVDGGNIAANGFAIRLNSGGVSIYMPGISFQTIQRVDDDQWHFVVVSRNFASGQVDIYLDGVLARGLPGTPGVSLTNAATLRIGVKPDGTLPLRATLDNLQIIPAALAADTVLAMYNRTLQSYCVAAGTSGSNVYWAKVAASQPDVRGGRVTASGGLTLTVDGDLPTAEFASLQAGEIVGPGQVIGGTAADATSGVGLVEVSINNGAWQPATGANTWAFSLAGQNGPVNLRVRATDGVGNVGLPSAPLALVVDGTAPVVTISTPPATIKPDKNAAGRWQVNLTGTANDASGIRPESLLVKLEQQSGVGVAQTAQQAALSGSAWAINYLLDAGLYDPTGAYTVTVEATDVVGNRSTPAVAVLRLDVRGPEAVLSPADATRPAIGQTIAIGGVVSDTASIAGIDKLEIAFTPVEQIAALPAGLTGAEAEAQLNRQWTPVTLAQRGPGVSATSWSYAIPVGLEDLYQIDLRGTDMLGNVAISANLWRGMIDTFNPRVVMTATATGASYRDAGGQVRYAVRYLCAAVDRNLDEATFTCPGEGAAEAVRSFAVNPELQALFPDLTIRNGLAISYTAWVGGTGVAATASACDTLGRCAQASAPPIDPGAGQPAPSGAPQATIVTLVDGAFVAAAGTLSVTVAAEATVALKTVAILLDGTVVQTLDFAQGDAITRTQRTVGIAIAGEGQHTLAAQATDWAGATQAQLFPVTFTLDTTPPAVAIDTGALTAADTWGPRSGMLRFNGTASDGVGLAAVLVRVDDGEFVDATFANGTWQTAIYVPDPEGRTLAVTVRAIDRAGRVTEISQLIAAAISAPDAPDTAITSGPANPSNSTTATFTFTGSGGAAVFECQLDEAAYRPCASPQPVDDLSAGSHVFRVRAIDSRGAVDVTPASFTWTVNEVQPAVTLTGAPANPTAERTATFTFIGDGSALAFECALDGSPYAACTSPQRYAGLGDGPHSFRVRARNAANQTGTAARHAWTVINAPPLAKDQSIILLRNQVTAITLSAGDDGPLHFAVLTPPAHGALTGLAPNLLYTPDSDYLGSDSFTFRVSDGQGASATGTVSITVATSLAGPGTLYLPAVYR
ncbi:MAG: cadherin-like domain-containing protein, partial [Caldilineaceae bacterium]|nr:cadherin-like domain-containing protein [Caldilineaceae bacterium]